MKKTLKTTEAVRLIDPKWSISAIYNQIKPEAEISQLYFAEYITSLGNHQWNVPGDNWKPLSKVDDDEKVELGALLKMRCAMMSTQVDERLENIFTVPSYDFIFVRKNKAGQWEIAVTAWGFKFPSQPRVHISAPPKDIPNLQEVCIAFLWNGKRLPEFQFEFNHNAKATDKEGLFKIDRPLIVGATYPLFIPGKTETTLVVEKGKDVYTFDLTEYVDVNVDVRVNGIQAEGIECDITFGSTHTTIKTAADGKASITMPLIFINEGEGKSQPQCTVACMEESGTKTPSHTLRTLEFLFNLKRQDVGIAFINDGQPVENYEFMLNGKLQKTGDDGFFRMEKMQRIGTVFSVENHFHEKFKLSVEEGRQTYEYDITRYFDVIIRSRLDGQPAEGYECQVMLGSKKQTVRTGHDGSAAIKFPFVYSKDGTQPECLVECQGKTQTAKPEMTEDRMEFCFDFISDKFFDVVVTVTKDGQPVEGQECEVSYAATSQTVLTDNDGHATIRLKMDDTDNMPKACTVTCQDQSQSKQADKDLDMMEFHFQFTTPPRVPEYVYLKLLDYGGYPLADMPVCIKLKKKGEINLITDNEGRVQLDKDWLTEKEKFGVQFTVTKDYQQNHDIHLKKKKEKDK